MLLMSPYQQFEALKAKYAEFFPADVLIWDFGKEAKAQNTERVRVIYSVTEELHIEDEGYVGVGVTLWQGPPCPTLRVCYHTVEIAVFAKHDVLYDQGDTFETYVPGLLSRVSTALENCATGPFRTKSTNGFLKFGTQNAKTCVWEHDILVAVPFPVSDLKGWLAQSGVVVAPITDITYEGEIDATSTDDE